MVKGGALRLARRLGRYKSELLRIIGISNDWVAVVICPDSRGCFAERPIVIRYGGIGQFYTDSPTKLEAYTAFSSSRRPSSVALPFGFFLVAYDISEQRCVNL
jgi:hypothetical protein